MVKCTDAAIREPCAHTVWKNSGNFKRFIPGNLLELRDINSTEPSSYLFKKRTCNFSVAKSQKRTFGRMLAITCAFFFFFLIACSVQNPCYLIDNTSRSCLHIWGQTWKKRVLTFQLLPWGSSKLLLIITSIQLKYDFKGDRNGTCVSVECNMFAIPLLREYTLCYILLNIFISSEKKIHEQFIHATSPQLI